MANMDVSNGFSLIESIQRANVEDVPILRKEMENAHNKRSIVQWFKVLESERKIQFIKQAIQCYLHIVSTAIISRISRILFKILMGLPAEYQEIVKKELESSFECIISDFNTDSNVKTLCEILNQNQTARDACKKFFLPTSKFLFEKLNLFSQSTQENKTQDLTGVYYTIKICIHCLQSCNETLKVCFASCVDDPTDNEIGSLWDRLLSGLLTVFLQSSKQELLELSGTAISMYLNVSSSLSESSKAYKEIINIISTDQASFIFRHFSYEKPVATDSQDDQNIHVLMLIKGMLHTSSKELLCHGNTQALLFHTFPQILTICRGSQVHHYKAFQVLALWFEKLKAIGIKHFTTTIQPQLVVEENVTTVISDSLPSAQIWDLSVLMSSSCPVLTSTLSTIWLNWDNPVIGVSEIVMTIFDRLLQIWAEAVEDKVSTYSDLSSRLMGKLLSLAWYAKTRYGPLCILLPYVDVFQLLEDNPEIKEDIMRCMNFNSLAAVASDVYNAFVTQMSIQAKVKNKCALSIWRESLMPTLLKGVTSLDSIQRSKICTYWIPHSLKVLPNSEFVLLEALELKMKNESKDSYIPNLLSWTTVCRNARDLLGMSLQDGQYKFISEALVCVNEEVRAEALFALCYTLKRTAPVSKKEIELLTSFISVNLKTDSPSFRHSMTIALKKLIVRLRDSCLADVRLGNFSSDCLKDGVGFIEWLFKVLVQNLFPGGSYQCRQTALDILQILLDLLVYQEKQHGKKGKAQEGAGSLLQYANSQGKWKFFSLENFMILLSCLEDGAEDFQMQCFRLLMNCFPWPSSIQWTNAQDQCLADDLQEPLKDSLLATLTQPKTICTLMNRAIELASSPKSYENHTGSLLIALIWKIYVQNIGLVFEYDGQSRVTCVQIHDGASNSELDPSLAFMDMLLQFLETSISAAKKDPAMQFKSHPIHGLSQYVTHCLKEALNNVDKDTTISKWCSCLKRVKDCNQEIIHLMLDVMSGGSSLDQCTSFADLGIALENLISANDDNQEEVTSLSPEYQLLLSWCWINLKESCSSLGQVVASAIKNDRSLLSSSAVSDIGRSFVRVLTLCRHKGAIEGCRNGFSQFCDALLSSKNKEFSSIPISMLDSVIQSLSTNALTESVSRRSAGVPIIVDIVTNQAMKIEQDKQFLKKVVDELYDIASQPLPLDHNQQKDLCQVHALNILKTIFCDASLAPHLVPLLSKLTILVIENFDSPSWAARNAATQLICTLVSKIFGQRNNSMASMTLEEFNSLHPELLDYILRKLQTFRSSSCNIINPSLYVVLTLLSNLNMSPSHLHNLQCRATLRSYLSYYLENPVHSLRKLSAKAYVALFELDKADEILKELLSGLIPNGKSLNVLDGRLLCVYQLICSEALSKSMHQESLNFFSKKNDLFVPSGTCFLPPAQVMLVLQKLIHGVGDELQKETAFMLWSLLESLILQLCQSIGTVQAGAANCLTESFKTMTLLSSQCKDLHVKMTQYICSSLASSLNDLCESVIYTLSNESCAEYLKDKNVQEAVWLHLVKENNISVFLQTCSLLYQIHDRYSCSDVLEVSKTIISSLNAEKLHEKWSHSSSVKCSLLMIEGILYHDMESSDLLHSPSKVKLWCDQILHLGQPHMNEDLRFSAARALKKGGDKILSVYRENQSNSILGNAVSSIIKAIVQFLEDSEINVRNEASLLVSHLMDLPHLHANLAFHVLSQYISLHLWWSQSVQNYLLDQLFMQGDLKAACVDAFSLELQRLFEPDADSEAHSKRFWAYHTLKAFSLKMKSKFVSVLQPKCCEAIQELQENMAKLVKDVEENSLFNASTSPRVTASLLGIALVATLQCFQGPSEGGSRSTELSVLVGTLVQLPHLHPLLKTVSADVTSIEPLQQNVLAVQG